MAEATLAGFRAQFPEFGPVDGGDPLIPDARVSAALEEAALIHSHRPLGTLLVAAHLVEIGRGTAGSALPGEVTSVGSGPLRTSMKTQAETGSEAFFTRTEYGRRFLVLEKRTARFAVAARMVG